MSPPYAPAFIHTPPPTCPGWLGELEVAEAGRAGPVQADGQVRSPPAASVSPSVATPASSPSSFTTRASTPSSAASRFDPRPTAAVEMPSSAAQRRTSSSWSSAWPKRAGPARPEARETVGRRRARSHERLQHQVGQPVDIAGAECSTRSPARARRDRKRAASEAGASTRAACPGGPRRMASTTSLPETPVRGSSRAA